jgi:hypothetical protein
MDPIEAAPEDLRSQRMPNYTQTAKMYGCDRSTLFWRHRGVTLEVVVLVVIWDVSPEVVLPVAAFLF